jgi:hypothetical protein
VVVLDAAGLVVDVVDEADAPLVVEVVDPDGFVELVVAPDFPVVDVDDDVEADADGFDVVAVLPRAVVAVVFAVVEVVLGLLVDVVALGPSASEPVVVVMAPAFMVVVVVGLAFLGSGTVQVRREEPS